MLTHCKTLSRYIQVHSGSKTVRTQELSIDQILHEARIDTFSPFPCDRLQIRLSPHLCHLMAGHGLILISPRSQQTRPSGLMLFSLLVRFSRSLLTTYSNPSSPSSIFGLLSTTKYVLTDYREQYCWLGWSSHHCIRSLYELTIVLFYLFSDSIFILMTV